MTVSNMVDKSSPLLLPGNTSSWFGEDNTKQGQGKRGQGVEGRLPIVARPFHSSVVLFVKFSHSNEENVLYSWCALPCTGLQVRPTRVDGVELLKDQREVHEVPSMISIDVSHRGCVPCTAQLQIDLATPAPTRSASALHANDGSNDAILNVNRDSVLAQLFFIGNIKPNCKWQH